MKLEYFENLFLESIEVKKNILNSGQLKILQCIGDAIVSAIKNGNKIMLCGNGGSAADAQHLAAEMLIRLRPSYNRQGIPALALAQDTSTITACGNDFGFEKLFERMVRSIAKKGDILIAITTSGKSANINLALIAAKELGVKTCGFLGAGGGLSLSLCDCAFVVPSNNTGRVQESHITAGHALMEYVEDRLIEDEFLHLQEPTDNSETAAAT